MPLEMDWMVNELAKRNAWHFVAQLRMFPDWSHRTERQTDMHFRWQINPVTKQRGLQNKTKNKKHIIFNNIGMLYYNIGYEPCKDVAVSHDWRSNGSCRFCCHGMQTTTLKRSQIEPWTFARPANQLRVPVRRYGLAELSDSRTQL